MAKDPVKVKFEIARRMEGLGRMCKSLNDDVTSGESGVMGAVAFQRFVSDGMQRMSVAIKELAEL